MNAQRLVMCDRTTGSFVTWPGPGGVAPANPLTENGLLDMRGGDDRIEVVVNDGVYACGTIYRVEYDGFQLTIEGGAGADTLISGTGVDNLFGDDTSDVLACMEDDLGGNDTFLPHGSADSVYGCGGDDTFLDDRTPGAGSRFFGNLGTDCIEATSGVHVYCTDEFSYDDGDEDDYETGAATTQCSTIDPDAGSSTLTCS